MPRTPSFPGEDLTRHHALARRYLGPPISNNGYTAMDLWKFYGLVAGLWFVIAGTLVRYGELFNDLASKSDAQKAAIVGITLPPILFALPVVLMFCWWLAGALVSHSRWQMVQATLWRWFWLLVLLFYGYVLLDPTDSIHPEMSRKGLWPVPNVVEILGNGIVKDHHLRPWSELTFQFQLGYFLLWFLFWFLVAALHWSYVADGLREVWFHAVRFRRYGVSILTGFRETARLAGTEPVTRDYPRQRPNLPPAYRGVPRLNVPQLTVAEAQAVVAADSSGAIVAAPGQPVVLFVDLGVYDFSPALGELRREDRTALLAFSDWWPTPTTRREELVVPLARSLEDRVGAGATPARVDSAPAERADGASAPARSADGDEEAPA